MYFSVPKDFEEVPLTIFLCGRYTTKHSVETLLKTKKFNYRCTLARCLEFGSCTFKQRFWSSWSVWSHGKKRRSSWTAGKGRNSPVPEAHRNVEQESSKCEEQDLLCNKITKSPMDLMTNSRNLEGQNRDLDFGLHCKYLVNVNMLHRSKWWKW